MHSTMVRKFGISDASEKFWFGENCLYGLYVCPSVYPSIHMTVHPHGCDNDHLINTEGQSNENDFEFDLQLTVSSYCMKLQKLLLTVMLLY